MILKVGSVVETSNPDPAVSDFIVKYLEKLVSEGFDPSQVYKLGGLDGGKLWFARGLLEQVGRLSMNSTVSDFRHLGPAVEVYLNEDKLDERSKYQIPEIGKLKDHTDGILVAPTGSGKTVMIAMIIDSIKKRTLVLTHQTEIANQIRASIKDVLGITAGTIGGGERDIKPVTVGLIQSVRSGDEILKNVGLLIVDEAHHISAPSYLEVLKCCPAKYRYGLTATIRKTDNEQKIIYAAIGPTISEIRVTELQDQGHLNKGVYKVIHTNVVASYAQFIGNRCWNYKKVVKTKDSPTPHKCKPPCTFHEDGRIDNCIFARGYLNWVYDILSKDTVRNDWIVNETKNASAEHPWTIVITHRKDHVKYLSKRLAGAPTKVWVAMGSPDMKEKERKASLEGFRNEGGILVATTQLIGEGFNAPKTSCLVRAMPSGGRVSVRQQTGRIMRPQDRPALIVDFVDGRIPQLERLWMGRRAIYKTLGFEPTKEESSLWP